VLRAAQVVVGQTPEERVGADLVRQLGVPGAVRRVVLPSVTLRREPGARRPRDGLH
jgi:hypothetical protein